VFVAKGKEDQVIHDELKGIFEVTESGEEKH